MINLSSVKHIVLVGHSDAHVLGWDYISKVGATKTFHSNHPHDRKERLSWREISTDEVKIETDDEVKITDTLFDDLSPIIKQMEAEYNEDPKTLFVILNKTDKASAALVRLLDGPWGGFPWAANTITIDF